jgi:hypothetical protein
MQKVFYLYNRIIFAVSCYLISSLSIAQTGSLSLGLQIPLQVDFEKEIIGYPVVNSPQEQKVSVLNYGINILVEKKLEGKLSIFAGAGFLRKEFNFKRFYNHELLNTGVDSLPIGTSTQNYVYKFLRFPFGASYTINTNKKIAYKIGGDFYFNWAFQKKYNGGKPFPDANDKLSKFQYSGNSANLFFNISILMNSSSFLEIEPFVEVYNVYKKDEVLFEDPNEKITHSFDAVGMRIKYFLTLKK